MLEESFDLFKLHDKNQDIKPRNWICANKEEIGPTFHQLIYRSIDQLAISRRELSRLIAKKLHISLVSSDRLVYERKEWVPLIFLEELLTVSKDVALKSKINDRIKHLANNTSPRRVIKAPKTMTESLCKIAGAHAADGTLAPGYFCITDGDQRNLMAFTRWLESEFDLKENIHQKSENEWAVRFHNKIFARFLNTYFGFPYGKKSHSTGMPEIIKGAGSKERMAFTIGAMSFEAGVGSSKNVSLCVQSKRFRDDLAYFLQENKLQFTLMERKSGGYWRFWTGNLSGETAIEWSRFFEPETEKWYKLQEFGNGYEGKVASYEEAVQVILNTYPRKSSSKVTTVEVLDIIKKLGETYRYEIATIIQNREGLSKYGGKWGHSLRHHLDILKETKMIKTQRRKFGPKKSFGTIIRETYCFNPNIKEWVIPKRKSVEEIY